LLIFRLVEMQLISCIFFTYFFYIKLELKLVFDFAMLKVYTVIPVLRGHLWDKEKMTL